MVASLCKYHELFWLLYDKHWNRYWTRKFLNCSVTNCFYCIISWDHITAFCIIKKWLLLLIHFFGHMIAEVSYKFGSVCLSICPSVSSSTRPHNWLPWTGHFFINNMCPFLGYSSFSALLLIVIQEKPHWKLQKDT